MITRSIARGSTILSLMLFGAACAFAQPYPNRPIRLIVPFAPGGGADNLARTLNARLAEGFGQSVVIDNRGGGGGTIGTELVARAAPDGYTLALVTTGHTINPSLLPRIPGDRNRHVVCRARAGGTVPESSLGRRWLWNHW